jgi:hypothetical protein
MWKRWSAIRNLPLQIVDATAAACGNVPEECKARTGGGIPSSKPQMAITGQRAHRASGHRSERFNLIRGDNALIDGAQEIATPMNCGEWKAEGSCV